MDEYPYENGDVIVLEPQVFVSRDEAVLNWKGCNYVPQEDTAERDRLRAAFDRIALDPAEYRHALGHVVDCEDNCEPCRSLARQALAGGVDAQERAADILVERDRLRAGLLALAGKCDRLEERRHEPDDLLTTVEAERDRLRAVVERAIGTIERAQFTGKTCEVCTETYRVLGDESIARVPDPPVGSQLDGSEVMGGQPAIEEE